MNKKDLQVTGTVRNFKEGNGKGFGFGFIEPDNGGNDVFFHFSGIVEGHKVRAKDKVMFDIDPNGKKGPIAINITKL